MPVTDRRLLLAPVTALVTAFAVVVLVGLVTGRGTTVLRLDGGGADLGELRGAAVQVQDTPDAGRLAADASYPLPASAAGHRVCVQLPANWRVTEPATTGTANARGHLVCTGLLPDRPGSELRLAVTRAGWVKVRFEGAAPRFDEVAVTVRGASAATETGPLDAAGRYLSLRPLAGQTVCVRTPLGWTVRAPHTVARDGLSCTADAVEDGSADVAFTLVRA